MLLKINIEMEINYSNVKDIINKQYRNSKSKNGNLTMTSLYYDFFKIDPTNMITNNDLLIGMINILGKKTDKQKEDDKLRTKALEKAYPITFNEKNYKYYGK
tara:strand:+ start:3352 stop:3657 length:306 start_codon:yes stop_codon:yes gene_type:complete